MPVPSVHPFCLPKGERLSLKRHTERLFTVGRSFTVYPLRIVYRPLDADEPSVTAILVSVSKRRFKCATDRNRIRRLLREAYRLNKSALSSVTPCAYHIAFLYIGNALPTFSRVQKSMQRALISLSRGCPHCADKGGEVDVRSVR
ncbi:MAG: ribonuclease P protein component [Tannerellaceae bacterium]|jgi:ribonuclease P protein component|nr:ribonuclease P protein component [Tannerellaceae bacterium]